MSTPQRALRVALVAFGAVMLLLYPISMLWPSGWAWHDGAPHDAHYFMMIVGIYATLGACLVNAARDPAAHLSVIRFAIWSSVIHAGIMAAQALGHADHRGHLAGDVPALLSVALVLSVLVRASDLEPHPGTAGDASSESRTLRPS